MKNELEYQVNEKQENSIRLKEWGVAESLKQIQIFIDTLSAICQRMNNKKDCEPLVICNQTKYNEEKKEETLSNQNHCQ